MSTSTQKTNVLEYDYFTIYSSTSTITLQCNHDYFHDYFNVFKYFPKVFDFFKYFFKYIVSINISFSLSHVMPAKLITLMHCNFTQHC